MKNIFSILFSLLILVSGLHLSFATHFCGGEVTATKFSLSGEKASCGMETEPSDCPSDHNYLTSKCCDDEVSVYALDNNYEPTSFQAKEISPNMLQVMFVPVNIAFQFHNLLNRTYTNVSPPDLNIASAVCLADICVSRT